MEHGAGAPAGEVPALQAAGDGAARAAAAAAPQAPREGEAGAGRPRPACPPAPRSPHRPVLAQDTERAHRFHQLSLEELRSQQAQERAQLLKSQRCDAKTRLALFKGNLKSQGNGAEQRELAKQVGAVWDTGGMKPGEGWGRAA